MTPCTPPQPGPNHHQFQSSQASSNYFNGDGKAAALLLSPCHARSSIAPASATWPAHSLAFASHSPLAMIPFRSNSFKESVPDHCWMAGPNPNTSPHHAPNQTACRPTWAVNNNTLALMVSILAFPMTIKESVLQHHSRVDLDSNPGRLQSSFLGGASAASSRRDRPWW